jgi:hypothetical protein
MEMNPGSGWKTPRIALGILLLLYAAAAIVISMQSMFGMRKNAVRVVVPAETLLTFDRTGTYTIFHEYLSTVDGVRYEEKRLPEEISIRRENGDLPIELEYVDGFSRYSVGGYSGVSTSRFTVDAVGDYVLSAHYSDSSAHSQTVLSIVRWHPRWIEFAGGMTVFGLFLTAGVMLLKQEFNRSPDIATGNVRPGGFTYENEIGFSGDIDRALSHARGVLTAVGFTRVVVTGSTLTASSPGMTNNKQPPLRGATEIQIEIYGGHARLRAELGGVRFMRNFLYIFPPGLALGLCAVFAIFSAGIGIPTEAVFLPIVSVLPWLFISPVLAGSIKNRTIRGLDGVLEELQSPG